MRTESETNEGRATGGRAAQRPARGPQGGPAPGEATGAIQAAGTGGVSSNTPPSNPSGSVQTGGEDWLDLTLYVNHRCFDAIRPMLDAARTAAENKQPGDEIKLGERTYLVMASGVSVGQGEKRLAFRWRLKADNGLILLLMNRERPHATMPNAMATAKSSLLMAEGIGAVWAQIQAAVAMLGAEIVANKVSRIDPCVDLPNVDVEEFDRPYAAGHYVTRARANQQHFVDEHFINSDATAFRIRRTSTGFSLGMGNLRLRVYDKARETWGKPEKQQLLVQRRWGEEVIHATRVEFQVRRERLKSLGIDCLDDWFEKRGAVTEYLTSQWFRLTDGPVNRKHGDRAPTLPLWLHVAERFESWCGEAGKLTLEPLPKGEVKLDQLVNQAVGLLVTILAREGTVIDSEQAFVQEGFSRILDAIAERNMVEEVRRRAIELGVVRE